MCVNGQLRLDAREVSGCVLRGRVVRLDQFANIVLTVNTQDVPTMLTGNDRTADYSGLFVEIVEVREYAPNYYPLGDRPDLDFHGGDNTFDIGCFGAIRPLKNQLLQAIAALQFCMQTRRYLRFHINSSRVEQSGDPILRNLRSLFQHTRHAELVEHPWMDHDQFVEVLSGMDFSMCASFSETFCIVAADSASVGVPVIASPQIPWIGEYAQVPPNDMTAMVLALMRAEMTRRHWAARQWLELSAYNEETIDVWRDLLRD